MLLNSSGQMIVHFFAAARFSILTECSVIIFNLQYENKQMNCFIFNKVWTLENWTFHMFAHDTFIN